MTPGQNLFLDIRNFDETFTHPLDAENTLGDSISSVNSHHADDIGCRDHELSADEGGVRVIPPLV